MAYSEEQIYDYFHAISARTSTGILITNTGYTGIVLTPEMISRLADLENVVAVKNSPKLPHTLETLRLAGDRIIVSSPDESIWFSLMTEHSCRVYMSSAAPYLLQKPGYTPLKDYAALVMQGRNEEAATINQSLEPARAIFNKWLRDPWPARRLMPIAYLKTWSELLGMVGGAVRSPLLQTTPAEREELRQDLPFVRKEVTREEALQLFEKLGEKGEEGAEAAIPGVGTVTVTQMLPFAFDALPGDKHPGDETGAAAGDFEAPSGFHSKPAWQRIVILAGGPAANFLVAMLLITGFLLTQVNTDPGRVFTVVAGSPAAAAGMQVGDSIRAVDGKPFNHPGLIQEEEQRLVGADLAAALVDQEETLRGAVEHRAEVRLDGRHEAPCLIDCLGQPDRRRARVGLERMRGDRLDPEGLAAPRAYLERFWTRALTAFKQAAENPTQEVS